MFTPIASDTAPPGRFVMSQQQLLLLLCLTGTTANHFIVCIHEAKDLADLDREQGRIGRLDRGSDAFVSIMVDGDPANIVSTGVESYNDQTPNWNECFRINAKGGVHTPLVFVAADADFIDEDDAIGFACTTAMTGTRWLELLGPEGVSRGRLRVQVVHLSIDDPADATVGNVLGWNIVESAASLAPEPSPAPGATTHVTCPRGKVATSCQCWSAGAPGCATAAVSRLHRPSGSYDSTCDATSSSFEPPEALPPCTDDFEEDADGDGHDMDVGYAGRQYGRDCAPHGWRPLQPSGVVASARCANEKAFDRVAEVHSDLSVGSAGDAVVARCQVGELMLGCAVSAGDGRQRGVRYEHLERPDAAAMSAATSGADLDYPPEGDSAGRAASVGTTTLTPLTPLPPLTPLTVGNDTSIACVAYSGTGGAPTRAVASCAVLGDSVRRAVADSHKSDSTAPAVSLSLVNRVPFGFKRHSRHAAVRCPHPFTLVGCSW